MRHTPPRGRFPRMRGGRFIGVPRRGRPANATRGAAGPRRGHPSRAALGGRIAAVVLMVLGLLGLGSSAWAYWTSSGVGTGAATTATLNAPGTPVITHTSGTQSVGVGWAAPSVGVVPEGYYVTRISQPGGVQVHVCGSPTVLVVPTSCVDNPVPVGSFHYLVTAVYRSWTSTSGPSPSVVIVTDVTAPVVTVTHVNGAARAFPFTSNATVATIGGECGMVPGDEGTVAPMIGGAATVPPTAVCSAGSWTLTLTTPVTAQGDILISATQSDAAGNDGTAPVVTVTVDTIRPTVVSIARISASPTGNTGSLAWTVTFSEPVSGVAAANFTLVTSGLGGIAPAISAVTAASGSPSATWTVTAALNGATSPAGSIRLDLTSSALVVDPAGNTLLTAGFTGQAYGYDTVQPQVAVAGVSSPLGIGSYKAGQIIPITVTFTESMIVGGTGTPQLTLATGNPVNTAVNYTGGSGTNTLTFTYTVATGNASTDLDYASTAALALNGGTIKDAAGNAAILTLAAPAAAGSLGANESLVIDTTPPVVTVTRVNTAVQTFPYVTTGTITSIGGTCGNAAGDLPPVTVLVNGSSIGSVNCSGAAWSLAVSWTTDGTRIVSATQADQATNTGTAPAQSVKVDLLAPTVIGVSSTVPDGSYRQGQVIPVTVTFSEPVNVTGTPRLTLRTRPTNPTTTNVNYTSGTGTNTLTFTYTVAAGHTSADLDYSATNSLGLNGGTIRDVASRNAIRTLAAPGAPGSLGATKSIVIDTTVPTVSGVSSPLPNGRYRAGQVVPVTVTFSEAVTVTGTPQLTLATGTPATTIAYTSGTGTTALTFTYTVAAGHTSADLDYTATTALALAGGSIADLAANAATLTLAAPGAAGSLGANKALVIDTTAPVVTGVASSAGNGTYRVGQSIPVTVTFSEPVAVTGTPQLSLATGAPATTAVGYSSGTGTTTLIFNYTIALGNASPDLDYAATTALALAGGTITDLAANPATLTLVAPGAVGSLGAGKNLVIDGTPPVVTVTRVNGTAQSFPFTTSATVTSIGGACGTAPGDVATVSPRINGAATSPTTVPCSSGLWTLGTALSSSGSWTLSATQADNAGNISTAADQALIIDKTPPTVSSIVRAGASQLVNSGPLAWTVTFSEPVSGLAAGNFGFVTSGLSGSPSISGVAPVAPAPSAAWTVTVGMGGVNGTNAGSIGLNLTNAGSVVDAVGNLMGAGTVTGQSYFYDTAAPTVTGVSSPLANDAYGAGQVVPVTVTFSEPVAVTGGTPRLTLATGPSATRAVDYTSGSGGTTLTFEYTIEDGDNSADLDYAATDALALNGGTIRDAAGNPAALALPAPGSAQSLAGAKALVVDTTPPEVVVDGIETTPLLGFIPRLRISGTAEVGSDPVTVYLCSGQPTCDASTAPQTFTVAVGANGRWSTAWTYQQGSWYASAMQTDAVGNVGTSEVFGPVAN